MIYGNEELINSLNSKKENLLNEKNYLEEEKENELKFLDEIAEEINQIYSKKEFYKSSKKEINKRTLINILQIIGVFSMILIPLNFIALIKTSSIINKIIVFCMLYGSGTVLALSAIDKKELKNNSNINISKEKLEDLENNKEYIENNLNKLQRDINKTNSKINKLNEVLNIRIRDNKYNEYIEANEKNKVMVKK